MSELTIDFILPVYNCETTICDAVMSLLHQKPPFKIILVDDGSTGYCAEVVDYFSTKYPDIINLIRLGERNGAAKARNIGFNHSTASIIAVCDADLYYDDRSTAIREFFEKEGKDVFYSALHIKNSTDMQNTYLQEAYAWDFNSKCPISHPTVAYRREVAEKCPYHEITQESDLYEFMLLDAHKQGFTFGGCNEPLMLKIEGTTKRDVAKSSEIKKEIYNQYGITI